MPLDATCPKCTHMFPVTEARHAFTVACPKCDSELTAEFKKPASTPEAGQPAYELLVKPGALPGATAPPPVPRKKKDPDDDEPVRKGGSAMIVLVSGGLGLLFVLGGLSLTGWFLFTQIDVDSTSTTNSNRSNTSGTKNNSGTKGIIGQNPNPKGNTGFNPIPNDPFVPPVTPPKPKDTFTLSPVSGAFGPISPPAALEFDTPRTVLLPGRAGGVAVGGGGRYIVLHFPQQGRLSVFDANVGNLTASVATDNGDALLAAGANKVVLTVPGTKKLRVYSLPDLERERDFDSPLFHGLRGITMGSRTNGPLLVADPFGEVALMNIATGKAIDGATQRIGIPQNLRAAPDGTMFLAGNGYSTNDKYKVVDESFKKWQVREPDLVAAYPGPDRRLYGKDQVLDLSGRNSVGKPTGFAGSVWYVPATTVTGNYFLRVNEIKTGVPPRTKNGVSVAVHREADTPVLTAWEGLPETDGLVHNGGRATEPLDRHLFLIPDASMLVIMNRDKTQLVVRKIRL